MAIEEIKIKTVPAQRGWNWFIEAWDLFTFAPMVWLLTVLVLVGVSFIAVIPLVGSILLLVCMPCLLAGICGIAKNCYHKRYVELSMLFEPITSSDRRLPLLILGAIVTAISILISSLLFVSILLGIGWGAFSGELNGNEIVQLFTQDKGILLLLIVFLGILFVTAIISFTYLYAVPLVYFDKVEPIPAIKLSFLATLKNTLPLLIASVVYLFIAFLAAIPIFLGYLILIPITLGAGFLSYVDIFGKTKNAMSKK